MQSIQQDEIVKLFMQFTPAKRKINVPPLQMAEKGGMMEEDEEQYSSEPPHKMYKKYDIMTYDMSEQTVWRIAPKEKKVSIGKIDDDDQNNNSNNNNKHVYYLHGGTYVDGFTNLHWHFVAKLVDRLHYTVIAPDYPLAPEHDVHDVLAMVIPLYKELVQTIDDASNLILMGDSAGGGMALALAQWLRNEDIEQPSNIILFSPWLDVTMTNPEISKLANTNSFKLEEIQELKKRGKM